MHSKYKVLVDCNAILLQSRRETFRIPTSRDPAKGNIDVINLQFVLFPPNQPSYTFFHSVYKRSKLILPPPSPPVRNFCTVAMSPNPAPVLSQHVIPTGAEVVKLG